MEWMYLGMVIFLFLLATFDLFVGVSNDAVNFLNSAIGAKVRPGSTPWWSSPRWACSSAAC